MLRVDLHTHLIPAVDDGSRSPVETITMARGLADLGVERIHLTPHQFKLGNAFTRVELLKLTDDAWRILARAGVSVEVVCGAEYYYGERFLECLSREGELVTFRCDDEECVLVELPMNRPAFGVERVAEALLKRGVRPVMAHPERTQGLLREPGRVRSWRDAGWRMQLNLLSLVGRHGPEARDQAHRLLEERCYDHVGSDIHRPHELDHVREAHRIFAAMTGSVAVARKGEKP